MEDLHQRRWLLHFILFFSVSPISSSQEKEHPNYCPESTEIYRSHIQKLEEITKNLSEIVTRLESKLTRNKVDFMEEISQNEARQGTNSISVTRYRPLWMEKFHLISEVRLRSNPTCIDVLPFRDYDGIAKFIAVGDELGKLYLFFRNGDFSTEFTTSSPSPITALLSYLSLYKNETILVTGHKDGEILVHKVFDSLEEFNFLQIESVGRFDSKEEEGKIQLLELHKVGRIKYILASYHTGKIRVFRENGSVHGSAIPTRRPLAFLKQRLLFLTETGAGSLDLRTMNIKESECEGLNHSRVIDYIFDTTERSRAYGFTSNDELIHVFLLGDAMNFKCRVRSRRKLEFPDPLVHHLIKGYLIVSNHDRISVYNVSSQHYTRSSAPRLLFSSSLDEIRLSTVNILNQMRTQTPLMASDREKLVVLGFGDGYIGVYRSNLPLYKGEPGMTLWSSPVLFFLLFLFAAWYFVAKKKEVFTYLGSEDAFNSTVLAKESDVMDLKDGMGMRRLRYASPSTYPFGESCSKDALTSAPVESNVKAASELKFRGLNLDSSGIPK